MLACLLAAAALIGCRPEGGGGGPGAPRDPAQVAGVYYDALGRGLTRQAYNLLGPDWRAAVPYEQFAREFRDLRVSDFRDPTLIESSDRLAKVVVRVRALPPHGAPRYYRNTLTLLREPQSGQWIIALADSREIGEEDYRE